MSGPLLGHGASVALAGVTNIRYVGNAYIGLPNIRDSSWQPNATVIAELADNYPTCSKTMLG
jgi:hypothetical protein